MQLVQTLILATAATVLLTASIANADDSTPTLEAPAVAVAPMPEPDQAMDQMLHSGIARLLADVTRQPLGHERYLDLPERAPSAELAGFPIEGAIAQRP